MAFVTGDIVASEDTEFPFKVVFKQGEEVVQEWLAQSRADAEEQILEALRGKPSPMANPTPSSVIGRFAITARFGPRRTGAAPRPAVSRSVAVRRGHRPGPAR